MYYAIQIQLDIYNQQGKEIFSMNNQAVQTTNIKDIQNKLKTIVGIESCSGGFTVKDFDDNIIDGSNLAVIMEYDVVSFYNFLALCQGEILSQTTN